MVKLVAVLLRDTWELALEDSLVEAVHVFCPEGRHKRAHLVADATEGPNIRLRVIRQVLPHFWGRIIRSTRLRVEHTLLGDLADIEVA